MAPRNEGWPPVLLWYSSIFQVCFPPLKVQEEAAVAVYTGQFAGCMV